MSARAEALKSLATALQAARALAAEDLVALDVSSVFALSDIFLLVSGRSERNVQAIADAVEDELNASGVRTVRREGRGEGRWILLDFGDLIVHVFHQEQRAYYDLERLWRDCPAIPLEPESTAGTL